MNMIFAIAAGGAIGAVARYIVMVRAAHWLGVAALVAGMITLRALL